MKHYTLLIFFTCFLAASQAPITKSLGEFSELKVYDLINVELIQSTENKIEITVEDTSNVYTVQKNNLLKIKMDLNPHNWNIILNWEPKKQSYKNEVYSYKVRDKEIKIK